MTRIFGAVVFFFATAVSLYSVLAARTQTPKEYILNCKPNSNIDNVEVVKHRQKLVPFTMHVDIENGKAFYQSQNYFFLTIKQNTATKIFARYYDDADGAMVGYALDEFTFNPLTGKFHQETGSSGDTVTSNTIDGTCKRTLK